MGDKRVGARQRRTVSKTRPERRRKTAEAGWESGGNGTKKAGIKSAGFGLYVDWMVKSTRWPVTAAG